MGYRPLIAGLAFATFVSTVPLAAQKPVSGHPDFSGFWTNGTMTQLQRPPEFADRALFTPQEAAEYERTFFERIVNRIQNADDRVLQQTDLNDIYIDRTQVDRLRTSLIVDPSNGMLPPLLPAAQARAAGLPKRSFDDPEGATLSERCLFESSPMGAPAAPPMTPINVVNSFYQIVQTNDYVMIVSEWIHDARIIRMNGTHVASSIRKWLGDSIGRWDGAVLVVDTTNLRPETHYQGSGERLHVVERFTKVDADTIRYNVTADDPDTWASPWTAEVIFRATTAKIFEVACHEGNFAIEGYLRGARADEQRALQEQPVR